MRSAWSLPLAVFALALGIAGVRAEDGYRLWLRYDRIADEQLRRDYTERAAAIVLVTPDGADSPTLAAAREELVTGLHGLLVRTPRIELRAGEVPAAAGYDGFAVRARDGRVEIAARSDVGVLYGAFALLRHLQTHQPVAQLNFSSAPKVQRRLLNHWDNLDGTVERGYAGRSLWQWPELPDRIDPRYRDYARANASLGINGTVLTNVNANARVLTADYLRKVAALAGVFRPYGIRVYLTARFSAPVEIGGLATADPLAQEVRAWWRHKANEIYRAIPDFGGFLVKANSEGQPGPQNYGRTHADGANLLADALAPHGGIVMWRAFVYDADVAEDRHKQAFNEFKPLDGAFRPNVIVQVKNGPIDFMPREPFHPLFGAMPRTPLALEVQITQEYLGGSTQLAYLGPMWQEVLDADTFRPRAGATVARIVAGEFLRSAGNGGVDEAGSGSAARDEQAESGVRAAPPLTRRATVSVMAGVANTGSNRNWSGNQLAPVNWYAFGRLAWDPAMSPTQIADEWTRMTFTNEPRVVRTLTSILQASHEAVVNYSMPLGLHHIMARDHHQGPGPWVTGGRADWTSVYYHRATEHGIGFDRTATGSNALEQYAREVARRWAQPQTCPEELLLWFHHLPWDYRVRSGRILWDELCLRYQAGVDAVRTWQRAWAALDGDIDAERFAAVAALFRRQEREARIWRDACTQYFATFSQRPLPAGVEPPEHPLDYYRSLREPFAAEMK